MASSCLTPGWGDSATFLESLMVYQHKTFRKNNIILCTLHQKILKQRHYV